MQFNGDCQMLSGVQRFPIEEEKKEETMYETFLWYEENDVDNFELFLHTMNIENQYTSYFILVIKHNTNSPCQIVMYKKI